MTGCRDVQDIESGPVSGRISEKCPVWYPAGFLTELGRTNIFANDGISQIELFETAKIRTYESKRSSYHERASVEKMKCKDWLNWFIQHIQQTFQHFDVEEK